MKIKSPFMGPGGSFLFAWRYFKAKKSTNAINIIAWISILGITIGTAALILVLSVFNGFEGLVKSLYSSFYTDLKILPVAGKMITITPAQLEKIRSITEIKNLSVVAEEKSVLQNGDFQAVVILKGVDENYTDVAGVSQKLVRGDFNLGNDENPAMVLGSGVESALGIQADRDLFPVTAYLPRKGDADLSNPLNSTSVRRLLTTGVFYIQRDFDNKYAITNLQAVRSMLGIGENECSGVEIALKNTTDSKRVQEQIMKMLGGGNYKVLTKYQQNQSLYSAMTMEKWVIYGVLSLILVVAAFTMIGALTMLVMEKEKDIAVLHALGGDKNFIQKIFLSEGLLLALIGGGIGMLLAVIIAWLQTTFHIVPLGSGSFMLNYFPVEMNVLDFILVGTTVFVIAILASWIPSRKAATQQYSLRSE